MLDKQSHLPIYVQIEERLKSQIKSGAFKSGDPVPSERELSEMYEVSRMTVRQAIMNLVSEGLLYREKGKGTFVSQEKIEQPLQGLTSFTEDMRSRGMHPDNKLIGFHKIKPDADIAAKLKLSETDDLFMVKRIRYADQKPMAIETTYIPVKLLPDLNEESVKGSFYTYIQEKLKLTISHASQSIEALLAEPEEANLLNIQEPSAVLHIERLSYLSNDIPFEVVHSTYRADRYKFRSEISR
ncbi:GntR family transcriptional regulator [Jeotgalibacillus sp. ET6]|uniref:GntR family transcriptional regulator n=1 Tax=Jeotgalibacillus sp. ET6 TaxID=3037260 RepID=UPI0024185083|nr:GntR family transcriptional regulator [Jeotgalibacillus sp. ET6]MDG5473948.1 GntR family transcriptional regulator [Jeotgalibacillus sp. ET6]